LFKENSLDKELISFLKQQVVVVFLFFAITAIIIELCRSYLVQIIPFVTVVNSAHYFVEKYFLAGIIVLNYFMVLSGIYFFAKQSNFKFERAGFAPLLEDKIKPSKSKQNTQISIYGLGKNEVLQLDIDDFIFAKSDGHYIHIYYFVEKNNIGKQRIRSFLVRNSLKTLMSDVFQNFSHVSRIHKSHIINYNYAKSVRNFPNNKGGVMTMNFVALDIPIGVTKINNVNAYVLLNHRNILIYN
jgi:hypothetical protein